MSDRPDFTLPVSIEAITIETLPIDIVAQTLGTVAIDIAAQSVGNIGVDIKAQTVGNISVDIAAQSFGDIGVTITAGSVDIANTFLLRNPGFEYGDFTGWTTTGTVDVTAAAAHTGSYGAVLGKGAFHIEQVLQRPVFTDYVKRLSFIMKSAESGTFRAIMRATYTDGNTSTHTFTNDNQTWAEQDFTAYLTAGKYLKLIEIYYLIPTIQGYIDDVMMLTGEPVGGNIDNLTVDIVAQTIGWVQIDIAAQTVGNIDINIAASAISLNVKTTGTEKVAIDIAAQTVGNVDVNIAAQAANVDVDIKAQTVDLNIKTSGGVNIVIDKLTQTAYTERRSTISNNGETASWWTQTGNLRAGKFFPRGMRGFINTIDVYCKDDAAAGGTISVYISPHPSMGYVASADATVTAGQSAAWKSATFNRMWNYDSLFIFIVCSVSDVKYGYDTGTPCDVFSSTDAGVTWTHADSRAWFRVIMKGETVGDIPVSGVVNTIEIPSLSSGRQYQTLAVPATDELLDTLQVGAGEVLIVFFLALDANARDDLKPRIYCDGSLVLPGDTVMSTWNSLWVGDAGLGIRCPVWDTTNHYYSMVVVVPYPFKRSLQIGFYNQDGAAARTGYVAYSYKKIA